MAEMLVLGHFDGITQRLSEDPDTRVLLLEAGPDYGSDQDELPEELARGRTSARSDDYWGYRSVSGTVLKAGKVVGGSSAVNSAMITRGQPAEYDAWAALGNPGWTFDDVLPYFRRVENDMNAGTDWHGHDGPLPVRRFAGRELTAPHRAFLDAAVAAGHRLVPDHNEPGAIGAGPVPLNRIGGVRESTALTYLAEARSRPNLTIRAGCLVDRVLFDGDRAIGVRLAGPEVVFGDRIILCGGAYGSPQILLRSGIGPADELRALGIEVRADLPGVGRNLQDHPLLRLRFAADGPVARNGEAVLQTLLTAVSGVAPAGLDLHVFPIGVDPGEDGPLLTLLVGMMRPESRGTLRLRSTDPAVLPSIDPRHLAEPADLRRLLAGIRLARELAATPPLAGIVRHELRPAVTDDLTKAVSSYQHAVGTCRMGPDPAAGAVVDATGAVHGVTGLSVVDASIMPAILAANVHLTVLMIAERCADLLTGRTRRPAPAGGRRERDA